MQQRLLQGFQLLRIHTLIEKPDKNLWHIYEFSLFLLTFHKFLHSSLRKYICFSSRRNPNSHSLNNHFPSPGLTRTLTQSSSFSLTQLSSLVVVPLLRVVVHHKFYKSKSQFSYGRKSELNCCKTLKKKYGFY